MKPLTYFLVVMTGFGGLSVKYATSLKCYKCEGYGINSACRNSLDDNMITTCTVESTLCSTIKADSAGEAYTKRSCLIKNAKNDFNKDVVNDDSLRQACRDTEGNDGNSDEEEEEPRTSFAMCNTDLCNGADDNSATKVILLISGILSIICIRGYENVVN